MNKESKIIAPFGRMLLKEIIQENKSAGGIILAGESDPENKTRLGEIVYNGIGYKDTKQLNTQYREGNKVYFGKHAGATVIHNNEKYVSLTESEVAAITL